MLNITEHFLKRLSMAYSITWDNDDKTVVLQHYMPNATKDDWYQLAKESAQMLSTVEHTVHLIIDERNVDLSANSADMRYLETRVPPNEGVCVIVVSRNLFLYKEMQKRLREQFIPKSHHEVYFVETVEDARTLLQKEFGVVYASL
jgi:hypothetical protein